MPDNEIWTLVATPWYRNCTDEFCPGQGANQSIGLFLPTGFCIIGLYKHGPGRQYFFVLLNNSIGFWKDPEADLYDTRQWRFWDWLRGK